MAHHFSNFQMTRYNIFYKLQIFPQKVAKEVRNRRLTWAPGTLRDCDDDDDGSPLHRSMLARFDFPERKKKKTKENVETIQEEEEEEKSKVKSMHFNLLSEIDECLINAILKNLL